MNTEQIIMAKGNPGTLARLAAHYGKLSQRQPAGRQLQAGVWAGDKELHFEFSSTAQPERFHTASVGKLCTALLVHRLVEREEVGLEQPVAEVLDASQLEGIFAEGTGEVTVRMLLEHTSGAADYFEDAVRDPESVGAQNLLGVVLKEPANAWTVDGLLDFTRQHLVPVGEPGAQFHYSDTGYLLLGRLIEKVSGRSFAEQLHAEIFEPLEMRDTALHGFSTPANPAAGPLAPLWLEGTELSAAPALSADWAGGGIESSVRDLLTFSRALHEPGAYELVSAASRELIFRKGGSAHRGIRYGAGGVRIVWRELLFLLAGRPDLLGGLGISAAALFYDPQHNVHFVQNLGDSAAMSKAISSLARVSPMVNRL